jgi:hypothetical protein
MKSSNFQIKVFLILLLVLPISILYAQKNSDCRVMVPALQGTYDGGCKNGLAHGKGTARGIDTYTGFFKNGFPNGKGIYTWASGSNYNGVWNMGLREGEGTFTETVDGATSVMAGIWKKDSYVGPKPITPNIIQKYNVVSTSFKRTGEGSTISFSFYQNGMNNNILSLDFLTDSGSENRAGKYTSFYNVQFPFHCKVTYESWNSLRTALYDCILEFEISQPGNWNIQIGN